MTQDPSRIAAVKLALGLIQPDSTIGLGSGRAVFALVEEIGKANLGRITAVTASSKTAELAAQVGITVAELDGSTHLETAIDGSDEVDPDLNLIKGGGAALLREKLVFARAKRIVIMVEASKLVERLGQTRLLPVEIVQFGWQTTQARVREIVDNAILRMNDSNQPVVTNNGNLLLDLSIPDGVPAGDLPGLAARLKQTLGVVEHGLFIGMATDVIVGNPDGSVITRTR